MNILLLGDVVGTAGCEVVRQKLKDLKRIHQIEITVANGENASEGNGILPFSANHLFDSGVDVITTGNHGLRRREIYEMLDQEQGLIRPANFHSSTPGQGYYLYDMLRCQICVINLQGMIYMEHIDNPFDAVDNILKQVKSHIILVDFHAEATAEKLAMAYYLDGRVTALVGTHTHVQTADERIFPQGMGYITDLGMCGVQDSILGVKPELALKKLRTNLPVRFDNAQGEGILSGVILSVDEKTGKSTKIQRVSF